MPYTVSLQEFPGLPFDAQQQAEQRFRRALDKALGDRVDPVLRAFQVASDSSAEDLSKEDFVLASAWPKAYDLARTAGFRDLGAAEEAFFEVRAD
jgi:hypothetical protein